MTDMDEIRELLSEYADAVFDRGAASGASNEVYPPNAGETSSRSALLQRVEALREERDNLVRSRIDRAACCAQVEEERDAALAAQKRAEEERDEANRVARALTRSLTATEQDADKWLHEAEDQRARALAAESALAALRAAPPDALRALSGAWRLRVAGYSTDLGTPHGTEAMVYRRCAAELDAALAPSPPAALRPDPNTEKTP